MPNPLVSIIIPTFNRPHFLQLTIESILAQTYSDYEIIVVDDGTPNDVNQILCQQYDKVFYLKIHNTKSPAKPRNEGIKLAKGKYIAFVDDDDIWLPNKLKKQVDILENNPDFGLVHGCCEVINENGILQNKIIGRPGSQNVKHGDVSLTMIGNWTVMMPTSFVRKEVIDAVGFFNETMPPAGEDLEFWARCSFETKFYYDDEPLVNYRVHEKNISGSSKKYILLPLFLKKVVLKQLERNRINKIQYQKLIVSLVQMQIRTLKLDFFSTLKRLFVIDSFWFIGNNSFKMFIYTLFFKK